MSLSASSAALLPKVGDVGPDGSSPGWPPHPPSQEEFDGHKHLGPDLAQVLNQSAVPYSIWPSLSSKGFRKLSDFAGRYDSSKGCRDKAPSKLGFKAGENGYDEDGSEFAAIRLAHAWEDASAIQKGRRLFQFGVGGGQPSQSVLASVTVGFDRR